MKKEYIWDNKNNCFRSKFLKQNVKNNDFVNNISSCIVYLKGSDSASDLINAIDEKGKTIIENTRGDSITTYNSSGNAIIYFNDSQWLDLKDGRGSKNSTALDLGHEFVHAYDQVILGTLSENYNNKTVSKEFNNMAEKKAIETTNKMAKELGEAYRLDYESARPLNRGSKSVTDFVNNQ